MLKSLHRGPKGGPDPLDPPPPPPDPLLGTQGGGCLTGESVVPAPLNVQGHQVGARVAAVTEQTRCDLLGEEPVDMRRGLRDGP